MFWRPGGGRTGGFELRVTAYGHPPTTAMHPPSSTIHQSSLFFLQRLEPLESKPQSALEVPLNRPDSGRPRRLEHNRPHVDPVPRHVSTSASLPYPRPTEHQAMRHRQPRNPVGCDPCVSEKLGRTMRVIASWRQLSLCQQGHPLPLRLTAIRVRYRMDSTARS